MKVQWLFSFPPFSSFLSFSPSSSSRPAKSDITDIFLCMRNTLLSGPHRPGDLKRMCGHKMCVLFKTTLRFLNL